MALPSGCRQVCRPNRRFPRRYGASDAGRIARYALESGHTLTAICNALNDNGVKCCECSVELNNALEQIKDFNVEIVIFNLLEATRFLIEVRPILDEVLAVTGAIGAALEILDFSQLENRALDRLERSIFGDTATSLLKRIIQIIVGLLRRSMARSVALINRAGRILAILTAAIGGINATLGLLDEIVDDADVIIRAILTLIQEAQRICNNGK